MILEQLDTLSHFFLMDVAQVENTQSQLTIAQGQIESILIEIQNVARNLEEKRAETISPGQEKLHNLEVLVLEERMGRLRAEMGRLRAEMGQLRAQMGRLRAQMGRSQAEMGQLQATEDLSFFGQLVTIDGQCFRIVFIDAVNWLIIVSVSCS